MARLTPERLIELVHRVADGALRIDEVWGELEPGEQRDLDALLRYEMQSRRIAERRRVQGPPQKKARQLLATLLTDNQRAMLKSRRYFRETAESGAIYEFSPNTGAVRLVTGERRKRGIRVMFCFHDDREEDLVLPPVITDIRSMPPADVTIGHLLLIRADEGRFLREANATVW